MTGSQKVCEEHKVSGERLVTRVKELIREGNVRRIIVKNRIHRLHRRLARPRVSGRGRVSPATR